MSLPPPPPVMKLEATAWRALDRGNFSRSMDLEIAAHSGRLTHRFFAEPSPRPHHGPLPFSRPITGENVPGKIQIIMPSLNDKVAEAGHPE